MPSAASAGSTSEPKQRACLATSSRLRSPIITSVSRMVSPSGPRTASPISSRRFSPATRTM